LLSPDWVIHVIPAIPACPVRPKRDIRPMPAFMSTRLGAILGAVGLGIIGAAASSSRLRGKVER